MSLVFSAIKRNAEITVKIAKKLLLANLSSSGDINFDSFFLEMLQLRITSGPVCNLPPTKIVFGLSLRNAFTFVYRLIKFSKPRNLPPGVERDELKSHLSAFVLDGPTSLCALILVLTIHYLAMIAF